MRNSPYRRRLGHHSFSCSYDALSPLKVTTVCTYFDNSTSGHIWLPARLVSLLYFGFLTALVFRALPRLVPNFVASRTLPTEYLMWLTPSRRSRSWSRSSLQTWCSTLHSSIARCLPSGGTINVFLWLADVVRLIPFSIISFPDFAESNKSNTYFGSRVLLLDSTSAWISGEKSNGMLVATMASTTRSFRTSASNFLGVSPRWREVFFRTSSIRSSCTASVR